MMASDDHCPELTAIVSPLFRPALFVRRTSSLGDTASDLWMMPRKGMPRCVKFVLIWLLFCVLQCVLFDYSPNGVCGRQGCHVVIRACVCVRQRERAGGLVDG